MSLTINHQTNVIQNSSGGLVIPGYPNSTTSTLPADLGTGETYVGETASTDKFGVPISSSLLSLVDPIGTVANINYGSMFTPVTASGGNSTFTYVKDGGTYTARVFTASGSLVLSTSAILNILVVGGGGGAGSNGGNGDVGGGGGGGVVYATDVSVNAGTYTITVGAKGVARWPDPDGSLGRPGTDGSSSTVFIGSNYVAGGGGYGAYSVAGASGTPQSNSGGIRGGGGAGAVGTSNGGNGINISDYGASAPVGSPAGWFGGGGAGIGGIGGLGGGGDSGGYGGAGVAWWVTVTNVGNAVENTGGGGGAANSDAGRGGNGGNGIVIISYRSA